MGSFSIWHWLILGAIVLLLFGGKGKISDLMGDFAKGIKSFKKGLSEEDEKPAEKPAEPAVARTTFGLYGSTEPSVNTTASAPAASAERMMVPALPGSAMRSPTTRKSAVAGTGS